MSREIETHLDEPIATNKEAIRRASGVAPEEAERIQLKEYERGVDAGPSVTHATAGEGLVAKASHLVESAKETLAEAAHKVMPSTAGTSAAGGITHTAAELAARAKEAIVDLTHRATGKEEIGHEAHVVHGARVHETLSEYDEEVLLSRPSSYYFLVAMAIMAFV